VGEEACAGVWILCGGHVNSVNSGLRFFKLNRDEALDRGEHAFFALAKLAPLDRYRAAARTRAELVLNDSGESIGDRSSKIVRNYLTPPARPRIPFVENPVFC
jgi:hypothetical protein